MKARPSWSVKLLHICKWSRWHMNWEWSPLGGHLAFNFFPFPPFSLLLLVEYNDWEIVRSTGPPLSLIRIIMSLYLFILLIFHLYFKSISAIENQLHCKIFQTIISCLINRFCFYLVYMDNQTLCNQNLVDLTDIPTWRVYSHAHFHVKLDFSYFDVYWITFLRTSICTLPIHTVP